MRELISLHIGQAGVGLGAAQWELYSQEHGVDADGSGCSVDSSRFPLFYETIISDNGRYVPRALFVDTDPYSLLPIRRGKYRNLFHPDFLLNGKHDLSSIFFDGFYSFEKALATSIEESIRKITEQCDSPEGFVLYHSISGGTGSVSALQF